MAIKVYPSDTQFTSMNLRKDPSSLDSQNGEYALLVNGRVRNGGIETIKLPKELVSLPTGKIQGVYGFDKYLLVFVDGKAYVRDYTNSDEIFRAIAGFSMSPLAGTIYACAVPASTVNFGRLPTADTTDLTKAIVSGPVNLIGSVNGSPACVVCQDGQTQPFVIFPDGTSRPTQSYALWANNGIREYVPVGRQMVYLNGILYLVIIDENGKYTLIAHSVTGRPLDFMINVDVNGDKLADEAEGGATSVAYNVDFGEVTCMSTVGASGGAFFVSTVKSSYLVTPDFTNTIFAEPTFNNQTLFATGATNNFSVVDLLGDAALIDLEGIKSFNAVLQLKFAGKNAPFSADIAPVFDGLIQTITAAENYDNYALFSVNTVYGPVVLVYDTLLKGFSSIDIYPDVTNIKQFAVIRLPGLRQLFFITTDNKLFQAFASTKTATVELYSREWAPTSIIYEGERMDGAELKPMILGLTFVDVNESGRVNATAYMDSQEYNTLGEDVTQDTIDNSLPKQRPFGDRSKDRVRGIAIDFSSNMAGYKAGFYIKWDFDARLQAVTFVADIAPTATSYKQQAREFATFTKLLNS